MDVQQNVNVLNPQPNPNVNIVLGPYSQQAYCPTCRQITQTKIKYVTGRFTWTIFFAFFILGLIFCSIIPFCVNSLKDCQHFCTQCHNYIGTYSRSAGRHYKRSVIVFCICYFSLALIYYFSEVHNDTKYT